MAATDHRPLADTPVTARISRTHNNRLGAVYSALHEFWSALNATLRGGDARRDSYTVLLFDSQLDPVKVNDLTSSPEEMLDALLQYPPGYLTFYDMALHGASSHLEANWSADRSVFRSI